MSVMGLSGDEQTTIMSIVAGVLHLGNIAFSEQGNYAVVADEECMYLKHDVTAFMFHRYTNFDNECL